MMRSEDRSTIRRTEYGFNWRCGRSTTHQRSAVGLSVGFLNLTTTQVRQLRKHRVCSHDDT
jgi:hypothetical protein